MKPSIQAPPGIVKKMRLLRVVVCLLSATCASLLHASILPIVRLEPKTLQAYEEYVAKFEKEVLAPYNESGRMWVDSRGCCSKGKVDLKLPMVEPRINGEIPGGSIHHFSGVMHMSGATIEDVRRIMQDYPNYPKYYPSDLSRASGLILPDTTAADEHYRAEITLTQNTVWMAVSFNCTYDTHYRRLSQDRWMSKSSTVSTREWRDPRNEAAGLYADSEDHGLLWRANTYWFVRASGDGIDVEADSLSLSRPIPTGFGWWGTKRTKDAVTKMLLDMKTAIDALHRTS